MKATAYGKDDKALDMFYIDPMQWNMWLWMVTSEEIIGDVDSSDCAFRRLNGLSPFGGIIDSESAAELLTDFRNQEYRARFERQVRNHWSHPGDADTIIGYWDRWIDGSMD